MRFVAERKILSKMWYKHLLKCTKTQMYLNKSTIFKTATKHNNILLIKFNNLHEQVNKTIKNPLKCTTH